MGTKVIDQILTKMLHGSPEEKHYIYNESDIILECKLCRNLFRALTGFILHRKSLCLKPIEKSVSISAYDQSMRSETFKNVTFITNISSQDPPPPATLQQLQEKDFAMSEFIDQNGLSTADHFQYLENYVSQMNETMESKSNLKAVLNLTQEVEQDNMADDRAKLLEDYVVQITSPVGASENSDVARKSKIVLTNTNSSQAAVMVSSPQGSSLDSNCSSSGSRTCHKNISQLQTNELSVNIDSDLESHSNCPEQSSQSPSSLLKIVSTDPESVTTVLDNSLEPDHRSRQNFTTAQHILASSISAMSSAKNGALTGSNSSNSKKKKPVEFVTEPLSSNGNSSATQIVLEDNLDSKNVIEIDDLDSLDERVTESLSLENLVYLPIDESSNLDPNLLQQQEQLSKQQQHLCSYCPNTLIYDSYLPFRRHLASVHGIQHDPAEQSLSLDTKHNSTPDGLGSERSYQRSTEETVLELADFQNLQCRKCKHSFTQRCSLRRHILEIHSEKLGYYSCPYCTNKVWFRYFRTFLAHLKNLHGFKKDQIYRIHRNLQKNSWVEFGSEQLPDYGNGSQNIHF